MITKLRHFLHSRRGLIGYTVLNYVDKGLTFTVPILLLFLYGSREVYNELEYIYSIAAIVAVVIELGVRNYFLYAYRVSDERDRLVERVRGCFLLQIGLYVALSTVGLVILTALGIDAVAIWLFVVIRTLFAFFISFFTIYYRLIDKPSRVFAYSIGANLATIIIMLIAFPLAERIPMELLFISQGVVIIAALVVLLRGRASVHVADLFSYIRQSLRYAWPIILNIFLFMFINNFGKIYARNYLTTDEMFKISVIQRAAIVIQLAHASAVGYLSKSIFVDMRNRISGKVLSAYGIMMVFSATAVLGGLVGLGLISEKYAVSIDAVTAFLILYTIVWCFVAYFEMYINRMDKNKYILLFSGAGALVFGGMLLLNVGPPLYTISLGMLAGMTTNLALVLGFLKWKMGEANEKADTSAYRPVAAE